MCKPRKTIVFYQRLKKKLKNIAVHIDNGVFPRALVCLDCQSEISNSENRHFSICDKCMQNLPFRTQRFCSICGAYVDPARGDICKNCGKRVHYFDKIHAAFDYSGLPARLIIRYKIHRETYLYEYIYKLLKSYFDAADLKPDYVCYVPMTPKGIRKRGFDHLKRVAECFADATNIPLIYPLVRVKESFNSKHHSKEERMQNIEGAFAKNASQQSLSGKNILLLDDVVTTASTVNECSKALKNQLSAQNVTVLCLCRR